MTDTPQPPLDRADEALIRYRSQRPSQFTARTIRDDYTAMLAEIGRLRAELAEARGHAESFGRKLVEALGDRES